MTILSNYTGSPECKLFLVKLITNTIGGIMSTIEKIKDIVTSHNLLHLATIDKEGNPAVRGVDYAAEENGKDLYFVTKKDSNKVSQISQSNTVSVVIDHDCPTAQDLMQLCYLKATAIAQVVTDPSEAQSAMQLLMEKFPFIAELPGERDDFCVVKISLKEVLVTDNRVSFNHTESHAF